MNCPYCGFPVVISLFIICARCCRAWTKLEFLIAKDAEHRVEEVRNE